MPKKKLTRLQAFLAKRSLGRNDAWVDTWSLVHFLTGVLFGWIMPPFVAVSLMILWEPLEIFIVSPFLAKFEINFGYETVRNSLSDITFDIAGVAVGYYLLALFQPPPFHLF